MRQPTLKNAAIVMVVITAVALAGWEIYLRNGKHLSIAYDDDAALWANKRAMVYEPADKAVVFIGSSRIKYDLDIPTWEKMTSTHAIQLALTGSSPMMVFANLANDPKFKGRLVVDVTEPLFYSDAPPFARKPRANITYFEKETPAQWAGFRLNHLLESQFVFLDKDWLSINGQLEGLKIPNRPGIMSFPQYPIYFSQTDFNSQTKLSPKFVSDTSLQNEMKRNWKMVLSMPRPPAPTEEQINGFYAGIKALTDKIKARGGKVIFTRTPSSGFFENAESHGFPRELFWNRILSTTGCKGYHYKDSRETDHFVCPEASHLKPSDAVLYTENLVKRLEADRAWE